MSETETVGLNLGGDFAQEAERAAQAAIKLAEGLQRAGESAAKLKTPPLADDGAKLKSVAREAEAASKALDKLRDARKAASQKAGGLEGADKEAFGWLNKLPSALAQAPPTFSPFQKLVGGIESWFGPKGASAFVKGAQGVVGVGEKYGAAIKMGGTAIAAGGAIVAAAAVALLAAAAALTIAGIKIGAEAVKFGIEQTSIREKIQNAIGASGYEVGIKIAGQYGLDSEVAFRTVKGLLAAKFKESEIPAIVRIAVGIGELKGEEKAKAFIEKLEVQKTKGGKATEETVKGFAEVGIASDAVYKKLAQTLHITVAQAQAKVKAGLIDTAVVLKAVQAAAADQFGNAADGIGNLVPVLLARVKLGFAQLFTGFDLGPLKDALRNAAELLEGSEGAQLKAAFSEAGSEIIKTLFGPFQGPEGKQRMIAVMAELISLLHAVKDAAKEAAPAVKSLIDLVASADKKDLSQIVKGQKKGSDLAGPGMINEGLGGVLGGLLGDGGMLPGALGEMGPKGLPLGSAFVDGIAQGINDNGAAIAAAAGLSAELLATVRGGLDIHSPSGKAAEIMGYFGDGLVKGAANDGGAAEAGASLAEQVSGSTQQGLGAGGAGGAAGGGRGGGAINITINISGAGGDAQAMGDTIAQIIRRELRSVAREGQERAA